MSNKRSLPTTIQLYCSVPKCVREARVCPCMPAVIPFGTAVVYADERGHGYAYHYDAFDTSHGGEGATVAGEMHSGNRIVSALGYLSSHSTEEGGVTEFPRLHLSVCRALMLFAFSGGALGFRLIIVLIFTYARVRSDRRAQVSPQVGRLVVFSNTDLNGRRYDESLHSGNTFNGAADRRKWIFNVWFRARAV